MTNSQASGFESRTDRISTATSITPTRHAHMSEYTSPSAYVNHDTYAHTSPNTPHGSTTAREVIYDFPASGNPGNDEAFGFEYGDFATEYGFAPVDHSTPPASRTENERTPVLTEPQHPIPVSSFPRPPNLHNDGTIRASSHSHRPLMSPFRTFATDQPDMMSIPGGPHQQFIDPSIAYYPDLRAGPSYMYPNGSPDQATFGAMPGYVNMQPLVNGQMFPSQAQYYAPVPHTFDFPGTPRSPNGSPTGSASSSVASLARSGSTSSELRHARPKVKLSVEDKRNIVELHRADSSLRQEDIARQYGLVELAVAAVKLIPPSVSTAVPSARSSYRLTDGLSRRRFRCP